MLNALAGCRYRVAQPLTYASSSVCGTSTRLPLCEHDTVDHFLGRCADSMLSIMSLLPMQPGDDPARYADLRTSFAPTTLIEVEVPRFVSWYRTFCGTWRGHSPVPAIGTKARPR